MPLIPTMNPPAPDGECELRIRVTGNPPAVYQAEKIGQLAVFKLRENVWAVAMYRTGYAIVSFSEQHVAKNWATRFNARVDYDMYLEDPIYREMVFPAIKNSTKHPACLGTKPFTGDPLIRK
jgi:hypothetical protein